MTDSTTTTTDDPEWVIVNGRKITTDDSTTTTFAVGDRVRLRASGAENWIDHRLQRRARSGTPATVKDVVDGYERPWNRSYLLYFDVNGRMKPMTQIIPVQELEKLENE